MTAHASAALAYDAFMGRWSKVCRHIISWLGFRCHRTVGGLMWAVAPVRLRLRFCSRRHPAEYGVLTPLKNILPTPEPHCHRPCHLLVADAQALPHEFSDF